MRCTSVSSGEGSRNRRETKQVSTPKEVHGAKQLLLTACDGPAAETSDARFPSRARPCVQASKFCGERKHEDFRPTLSFGKGSK